MAEIKDCCSCIYANRSTFTEPCVSCGVDFKNYVEKPKPKRKRKTNADLIRAMTDEELADEILKWFNWLNAVEWDEDRIINWLKQEAET